ncbi:MAG TPA: hypothetical protein ENH75_09890 [archaeon]|nr:hypothetical protein [archaeon]
MKPITMDIAPEIIFMTRFLDVPVFFRNVKKNRKGMKVEHAKIIIREKFVKLVKPNTNTIKKGIIPAK